MPGAADKRIVSAFSYGGVGYEMKTMRLIKFSYKVDSSLIHLAVYVYDY